MKTLALVNQKGGCGKTTSAVHLAGALASKGQRVLLVDLDPQAHATLALGCAVEHETSVVDVLVHGSSVRDAIRQAPGGIELLPASLDLAEFEDLAARILRPERILGGALLGVADRYDWVLVDCPPRVDGVLAANAIRAASWVVLVVETDTFAHQGALRALRVLEDLAGETQARLRVRVLATMYESESDLAREILIANQARFGPHLFDTVIRTDRVLRESVASGLPVQVFAPDSRAALDFDALAEEVSNLGFRGRRQRFVAEEPAATDLALAPGGKR